MSSVRSSKSKRVLAVASLIGIFASFCTAVGARADQGVPECFANPPRLAGNGSFSLSQTSAPCEELNEVLLATDQKDVAWIPGAGLNAILGLNEGGFATDSYALQFRVSQRFNQVFAGKDELVRFANDEGRARGGSWWTTLETVTSSSGKLVTAADLAARLALPQSSVPHVVAYSSGVAVGTLGYFGIVAPAFGRSGGGVQFWFPSEPVFTRETNPY
jgi:hypothetical protein